MNTVSRPTGLIVELPDGFTVETTPSPALPSADTGRRRYTASAAPADTASRNADVVDALTRQGLTLVDEVPIAPHRRRGRAAPAAGPHSVAITVPVNDAEDSVVLLEQDGYYSWQFPTEPAGAPGMRRRGPAPAGAGSTVRFELPLDSTPVQPAESGRRGVITDFVIGRLRAIVFKFAAEKAVDIAMERLERNVVTGLVVMAGSDPQAWTRADSLSGLSLPAGRPARILLFLHGTFSSTAGSFGAIGAYPWGAALLAAAAEGYDAVVGYDHATLSVGPEVNAKDLLARLSVPEGTPPRIDVVAFSRGGLVFRSLAEQLLPNEAVKPEFGHVVFVGVPNGGTNLAEPENWEALADLYTNLIVGASRLVGLIVPATITATILGEAVKGLAAFVKYVTTHAVAKGAVPGIAAMQPKGAFITEINRIATDRPAEPLPYYAILSEFKAQVLDGDHEPRELPRRLVLALIDRFGDRLLGGANDLVVDTASMCAIDPEGGDPFSERFNFGITPYVYHTIYFTRPEVTQAIGRWLELGDNFGIVRSAADGPASITGRRGYQPPVSTTHTVTDLPADALVSDLVTTMAEDAPDYVIIDRVHEGNILRYAVSRAEALVTAGGAPGDQVLIDVFNFHEPDASPTAPSWAADVTVPAGGGRPEQSRLIVVEGRRVIDVRPSAPDPLSNSALLRWVGTVPPDTADSVPDIASSVSDTVDSVLDTADSDPDIADSVPDSDDASDGSVFASLSDDVVDHPLSLPLPPSPPDHVAGFQTSPALPSLANRRYVPGPATSPSSADSSRTRGRTRVANVEAGRKSDAAGSTPKPLPADRVEAVPEKVTVNARAECARTMKKDSAETVRITLSREQIAAAAEGDTADDAVIPVDTAKPIDIEVWPRQGFALSAGRRGSMPVPAPGQPEFLTFEVVPETEGEGELWVLIRQEANLLGVMELHVRIVSSVPELTGVTTASLRVNTGGIVPSSQQLQVFERTDGNGETIYHYVLELPGVAFQDFESDPINNRDDYIARLYANIEERALNTATDVENFKSELEEFGADLFMRLFPQALQQTLWNNRKQLHDIRVVAKEPFIPWELVLLRGPDGGITEESFFLAERGLTRWLLGTPSTNRLRLRRGHLRCLAPRYLARANQLPWAEKEAEHLQREYGAVSVPPTSEEVRRLLGQVDGFDGLHVASHGIADAGQIQSAKILLQERLVDGQARPEYLSPVTVENRGQLNKPEGRRPIVVVNACQLGRSGFRLTAMGGFAQAFLASGAGAFVGTLWEVNDKAAFDFSVAFYKALHEGRTLAEAATAGREAARPAGDASWLAYSVYGDPRATLET